MDKNEQRALVIKGLERIGKFPRTREAVSTKCWRYIFLTFIEEADNTETAIKILFDIATLEVLPKWAYHTRRCVPDLSLEERLILSEGIAKNPYWAHYTLLYAPDLSPKELKILGG